MKRTITTKAAVLLAAGTLVSSATITAASADEWTPYECQQVATYCNGNYASEGYGSAVECFDAKTTNQGVSCPGYETPPGEGEYDRTYYDNAGDGCTARSRLCGGR